uniref:SJCHGC03006 protein n=1 Tax=Schistosoma japonicum TaxID=6182 RepID=Q5DER0_SCHJA|nr:SJCHGC03006 protein [Schistosoma japonicum]
MCKHCFKSINKTRLLKNLESLAVFRIFEKYIQDFIMVIHLTSLSQCGEAAQFILRLSRRPTASSRGFGGVRIAVSLMAKQALFECIPLESRLYTVRLNSEDQFREDRYTR